MKKLLASLLVLFAIVSTAWSATVEITYRYLHNGNVWYTETKTGTVGQAYPEVTVQPDGVKYLTMPVGTVSSAETVDIECEYTTKQLFPFVSDTFNDARWVYMAINSGKQHLQFVSGQEYITINTSQTTLPSSSDYQWAFVGNPFTGYKIMNHAAGSGQILTSTAVTGDGGTTYPTMKTESGLDTNTYNTYWDLKLENECYIIARRGETVYMNRRGSKLAYWTGGTGTGSQFVITPAELTLSSSLNTSKSYQLINHYTGQALGESQLYNNNQRTYESNCAVPLTTTDYIRTIWQLEQSGSGYKLKNSGTGNYLNSTPPSSYETMSGDPNAQYGLPFVGSQGGYWYWPLKTDGQGVFYFNATNVSGEYVITTDNTTDFLNAIYDDGYMITNKFYDSGFSVHATGWNRFDGRAVWELREVTPESYATSITSGNYYRLVNCAYIEYSLEENAHLEQNTALTAYNSVDKLYADLTDENSYGQIWKLTKSGSSYSLQNALTGKYIQSASSGSQFTMGTSAVYFTVSTSTVNGATAFTFTNGASLFTSWGYKVKGGDSSQTASKWMLIPVTVDNTALNNAKTIMNGNGTNYTTQLSTFFSDKACTVLNSSYASMTDAQLRSAMSSLPTDLQEMAVRVKNNKWNDNTTWNHYEKDFRIHSYEIYSNCDNWNSITQTGAFARLSNPTGIQAHPGDVIYIFVDSNVKDSNASLQAELVWGTNREGTTKTLSQGYNAICATSECEVFITYLLNSTSKSCNDYPNIKIHIEGGTCNGFFDMHRGHSNSDWAWMKENMFKGTYLHVKGESSLMNLLLRRVKNEKNVVGVMNIWDFIFDTEESFSGADQWKSSGKYKMMVNHFNNVNEDDANRIYPYWGAGHGSSHPDLCDHPDSTFSYNNLASDNIYVIAHELGHAHQNPIKWVGSDEVTNNILTQLCLFLAKDNIGENMFQSAVATRGDGVKTMTECFNDGWSYIDYTRRRIIVSGANVHELIGTRWLFQLWLYFDYMKHYNPATNQGFDFISALYNKLRASGLDTSSQLVTPENDYLKVAKYCAEIVQADLSEFFEAWGFWRTTPKYTGLQIPDEWGSTSQTDSGTTYYAGGYGYSGGTKVVRGFDMSNATSQVNTVRNTMKAYSTKINNILFVEDRGVGCTVSTTEDGLNTQTLGDHGYYGDYNKTITGSYKYCVDTDNNAVSMSGGSNAVGFKVYDASGNLVAISNMNSFSVPAAVATGLANGTYTLVAAQGDGTDVATSASTVSGTAITDLSQLNNNMCYTIHTVSRGYLSVKTGKDKMAGNLDAYDTSNQITYAKGDVQFQFAFITYNGNKYLYSVNANKFVTCTGTLTESPSTNDIITVEPTTVSVSGYPFGFRFYKGTSAAVTCVNLGGSKQLTIDTWGATYGTFGEDGNAWCIEEAADFDPTYALSLLSNTKTVTYNLIYNGSTIRTTSVEVAFGHTPSADDVAGWSNGFLTYSVSPSTITSSTSEVNITATWNGPFEFSTNINNAQWYNMHIRGGYYVSKGDTEPYYPATATTLQKSADEYQWAFAGNPLDFVIWNKASGEGYTLTKDGSNVVMRSGTYTWTLCKNSDGFTLKESGTANNYVNQNGGSTGPLQFWNSSSAAADNGSTFRVEEIEDNYYPYVAAGILPYIFANPTNIDNSEPEASIGHLFGITAQGAADIVSTYQSQLASQQFSFGEYAAVKALFDASILYPEEGKTYLVKNTYNNKYLRVAQHGTRGQVFADYTAAEAAADEKAHFTIKVSNNLPYMGTDGHYFNWVYTNLDGYEAYTIAEAETLDKYVHFASPSPGIGAFSLALGNGEGTYASYLGSGFYALKNGTTTVAGSTTDHTNQYAQWIFEELNTKGDVDGNGVVEGADLPMLVNILVGKANRTAGADVNGDGNVTIADLTKLVNILNGN